MSMNITTTGTRSGNADGLPLFVKLSLDTPERTEEPTPEEAEGFRNWYELYTKSFSLLEQMMASHRESEDAIVTQVAKCETFLYRYLMAYPTTAFKLPEPQPPPGPSPQQPFEFVKPDRSDIESQQEQQQQNG